MLASAVLVSTVLVSGLVFGQAGTAGDTSGATQGATEEGTSSGTTAADQAAREEAAQRFQRGLVFYGDGDYALALIEFDRAYQLVPDYRVLYNIGQVSIQLSRFARARVALTQYLKEGGASIPAERIEQVNRDLRMLEDRTAYLELDTTPAGVEIFVDDRSQGETPLAEPLLLDAGEHQVVLKKKGFQTVTRRIVLAGSERLPLSVELVPEEQVVIVQKPEPEAQKPLPQDQPERKGPHPAVYAWIGTGVLATAAITTGILGLDAKSRYDAIAGEPDPDQDDLDAAGSEARALFLACDILSLSTAVALGTSLYLTLHKPKAKATVSASAALERGGSLELRVLPSSVRLVGTF